MNDTNVKAPVTIQREELYRQVGITPMSRLAKTCGISGNGMAKVCDRLKVPYPPRGYWAKKAAGKKMVQYRLLEREEDTPASVVITPTPPPIPQPAISPEMKQRADDARQQAGSVPVPARLVHPHPVVATWLSDRERQRELARFEPNPTLRRPRAPDWTDIERRRHRILDALFKAAEKKGIRVKQEERKGVYFETSGEPLEFRLKEKQKQVRIPKSAEEMKRLRPGE